MVHDRDASGALAADLESGERLLWAGKPAQGIRFRVSDTFMIPFSILWGGFAIFWEATAIGFSFFGDQPVHPAGPFFVLWGIPFVCIGLYIMVGRFFWDAHLRRRTYYGVASRHILIRCGNKLTVLDLGNLPPIQLNESSRGRGTLSFGPNGSPFGFTIPAGWPGTGRYQPPAFELIEQPRDVMRDIREAQNALRSR